MIVKQDKNHKDNIMLHFLSNIISGMIWNRTLRDKVRVMIRYPQVFDYIRFVRQFGRKYKKRNIQTRVGRGCRNFVVILNKKFVFNKLFSTKKHSKNEVVTAFSGLLELSRINKVITYQEKLFGDINVEKMKKA